MAESMNDMPVAATVLGTIGTVFWCIQLVPQIYYNWRRKNCQGLPPLMMFLWAASGVPFAAYFIIQESNIPVQIQPHIFEFLSWVTFAQALFYPPIQMKWWKVLGIVGGLLAISAGIECALIFPIKPVVDNGTGWPVTVIGVIAAILLGAGLIPPYFELWKRNGQVVGINFVFLAIDTLGALFSLLSLVAQKGDLDILGCVLYIVVLVLEIGIYSSHIVWLLRTRKERKEAKLREEGQLDVERAGDMHDDVIGEDDDDVADKLDAITTSSAIEVQPEHVEAGEQHNSADGK